MRFQVSSGPNAAAECRTNIHTAKTSRNFRGSPSIYLRQTDLVALASDANIEAVVNSDPALLPGEKTELIGLIRGNARQILLIAVEARVSMQRLLFILRSCINVPLKPLNFRAGFKPGLVAAYNDFLVAQHILTQPSLIRMNSFHIDYAAGDRIPVECVTAYFSNGVGGHLPRNYSKRSKTMNEFWLLKQMWGIAGALANIHNPRRERRGYHHDIKPHNMLVFKESANTIKFTDWGCASFDDYRGNTASPTSGRHGMFPYLPPESFGGVPTSRPHDIWSLGCVFVELLVWFIEGIPQLDQFTRTVADANVPGGRYGCWYLHTNGTSTRRSVLDIKLNHLEQVDGRKCAPLVKTIRRMFDVRPKHRINAGRLEDELKQLLNTR
ncbi:kinase-like protein [Setomelanomma holmii]|uniref:Kinase-like protein n=1 Tax=Setomelanomma holmii TaxID=210430 RepID=A0A9P4LRN3_9PLEO|nr:kinase-like protein [Setomelanomma holmii]